MNLVKKDDDILDTYVIVEKPVGLGFCIGDESDLERYENIFFKPEEKEDYIPFYAFNNDLPYRVADTRVCFFNKKTNEVLITQDTNVVVFADYETIMLNNDKTLNSSQLYLKNNLGELL